MEQQIRVETFKSNKNKKKISCRLLLERFVVLVNYCSLSNPSSSSSCSSLSGIILRDLQEVLQVLRVPSRCPMSWVKLLVSSVPGFSDMLSLFSPVWFPAPSNHCLFVVIFRLRKCKHFLCPAMEFFLPTFSPHRKTTRFGLPFVLFKEEILFPMLLLRKLFFCPFNIFLNKSYLEVCAFFKSNVDGILQFTGFIIQLFFSFSFGLCLCHHLSWTVSVGFNSRKQVVKRDGMFLRNSTFSSRINSSKISSHL